MTTVEMLASVEARIRKDIPRLMELREGCIIESSGEMFKVIHILENYPEYIYLINLKNNGIYSGRFTYPIDGVGSFGDCSYKIIGHEIMLNDVLEWLQLLDIQIEVQCYSGENTIGFYYVRIDKNCDVHEEMEIWNLSSPYLKDQSEELIKFLYELIKE